MSLAVALPAALLAASPLVSGATLTWDPSLTGTGSDGAGTWDTTTAEWSNGTSDQAFTPNDGSNAAVFGVGGTAGTVTLAGPINASGLTFNAVASGSNYTLDTNGNALTLGSGGLTVANTSPTIDVASGQTLSITNGGGVTMGVVATTNTSTTAALTLSGGGAFSDVGATSNFALSVGPLSNPTVNGSEISTFDASGLNSFAYSNTGSTSEFDVGANFRGVATAYLPNTGANPSSAITVGSIRIGDTASYNAGSGTSSLYLGNGTNNINANTINVGYGKEAGQLLFNATSSGGTLTLNGQGGAGTTANMNIGYGTSGTGTPTGTVNFNAHAITLNLGTVNIGYRNSSSTFTGSAANGSFSFDTGTVNVSTLMNIAQASSTGPGEAVTGTLTLGGSATLNVNASAAAGSHASDFYIGRASTASSGAAESATGLFDLKGGTANINSDIKTAGVSPNVVSSTVLLEGGTLNMMGNNIGTSTGYSAVTLTTTGGTLENVNSIDAAGGVTMATAGNTLNIGGTNEWSGPTAVNAGTVALLSGGLLGNTAISVGTTGSGATNGTFAAAAGTHAGTETAGAASVTINPGSIVNLADGTVGDFTINQGSTSIGLTLNTATVDLDLSSGGADELVDTGTALVSNTNTININAVGSLGSGQYTIISAVSGLTGNFDFSNGTTTETLDGATLTLSNSDTAETLTVAAVPEPTMIGLVGTAAAGLLIRRRRNVVTHA